MVRRLFGANPLTEPMKTIYQVDPEMNENAFENIVCEMLTILIRYTHVEP